MTGPDHYQAAQLCQSQAARQTDDGYDEAVIANTLLDAQVHATLAVAAALAEPPTYKPLPQWAQVLL